MKGKPLTTNDNKRNIKWNKLKIGFRIQRNYETVTNERQTQLY